MMLPSDPHVPFIPFVVSATGTGVPPRTETFLSSVVVKKPSHSPSGEKKGQQANSDDGIAVATTSFVARR